MRGVWSTHLSFKLGDNGLTLVLKFYHFVSYLSETIRNSLNRRCLGLDPL